MRDYWNKLRLFSHNARLIMIVSFLTGLAIGGYRLLFNFYALSLGNNYNEAFLGTLQTLQSLAAILAALPVAYLAGRFRHKPLLLLVSTLSSLSLIGMVLLPVQASLIAFRMLFGVALAGREVIVAPFLLANTDDDERQWVFSFNLGLTMTATFIGNTIGGSLPTLYANILNISPTDTLAYQAAIGTLAGMAALGLIPLIFVRPSKTSTRTRDLPWHLLRDYGWLLLPYFLPQILVGLGAGLMQPFMNLYFRSVYAQPDPVIGLVFASGAISMAIAQFVAPPLADRRGKINVVILSQALSIPFLLILGIGAFAAPSGIGSVWFWFILAAIAFNVRLGLMNMGNPVYQTFMLDQVPNKVSALAVSLSSISFQFGWFVMPQVSGELQVRFGEYGFVPIFFSVAALYFGAVVLQLIFFRDVIRENKLQRLSNQI